MTKATYFCFIKIKIEKVQTQSDKPNIFPLVLEENKIKSKQQHATAYNHLHLIK